MLYLLAVFAIIAAAALLAKFANRQIIQPFNSDRHNDLPPAGLRPLFEPTEDDLREFERNELAVQKAKELEAARSAKADRELDLRRLLMAWRTSPSRQNTVDVLKEAAEIGKAELFSEVSEEIIKVFNEQGVGGLSPGELAVLINSHCRLLPQAERSSGALFWLKEETARLCS